MNILIFEDNSADLNDLLKCIEDFFSMIHLEYHVKVCSNSDYIYNHHLKYDLIFLDIQVDKENGIDIACKVRTENRNIAIIFITNYTKYLIEGYRAQANRYFVKPIHQEEFNIEMENVISVFLNEYDGFYDKKISIEKIYYKQVVFIEFFNRKTILHFSSGEQIPTKYSLKDWIKKLEEKSFAQPYKSLLINLTHISGFTKNEIILDTGEYLPISRGFREDFKLKYIKCLHSRI